MYLWTLSIIYTFGSVLLTCMVTQRWEFKLSLNSDSLTVWHCHNTWHPVFSLAFTHTSIMQIITRVQLRCVLTLLPLKQHLLSRLVVITKSDCLFHIMHASDCEAFVSLCCAGAAVHRPPSVSWQTWSYYINAELRVLREKGINQSMSQNQIQLLRITCWEKNNASCLFVHRSLIVSVTSGACLYV